MSQKNGYQREDRRPNTEGQQRMNSGKKPKYEKVVINFKNQEISAVKALDLGEWDDLKPRRRDPPAVKPQVKRVSFADSKPEEFPKDSSVVSKEKKDQKPLIKKDDSRKENGSQDSGKPQSNQQQGKNNNQQNLKNHNHHLSQNYNQQHGQSYHQNQVQGHSQTPAQSQTQQQGQSVHQSSQAVPSQTQTLGQSQNTVAKKWRKPLEDKFLEESRIERRLTSLQKILKSSSAKLIEFLELPYKELRVKRDKFISGYDETLLKIIKLELDQTSQKRVYPGQEFTINLLRLPKKYCSMILQGRLFQLYESLKGGEVYITLIKFIKEASKFDIMKILESYEKNTIFIDRKWSTDEEIYITLIKTAETKNPFIFPTEVQETKSDVDLNLLKRDLDWYEDRKGLASAALVQKKINIDNVYADLDVSDFSEHEVRYLIAKRINTFYYLFEHGSVEKYQRYRLGVLNINNGSKIKNWLDDIGVKFENFIGNNSSSNSKARTNIVIDINSSISKVVLV
jgi:hypothetical protein